MSYTSNIVHQETKLPNGMRVVTESLPGAASVGVSLGVGVGARYENEDEGGITHFIEHMLFKSTKTLSTRKLARSLDKIHAEPNAQTGLENTIYELHVLPEKLGQSIKLLADMTLHPALDKDEFRTERQVVCEEIAQYKDSPVDVCDSQMMQRAFAAQALGRPVLGTQESLASFTPPALKHYMQKHYRPDKMVLAVAGNIDPAQHERIVELAKAHFQLPSQTVPKPKFKPARYVGGDVRTADESLEQTYIRMCLPVPAKTSRECKIAELYKRILDGGSSSRLHNEVREKRGLAYSVNSNLIEFSDNKLLELQASATPENAGILAQLLCRQIKTMAEKISHAEFERAKIQYRSDVIKDSQAPDEVATIIANDISSSGKYQTVQQDLDEMQSITQDEVEAMAREMTKGKLTFSSVGDASHIPPYADLQALIMPAHASQVARSKKTTREK